MVSLYLFSVLKIGLQLHQKMLSYTACKEVTYASAGFAGPLGATYRLWSMMSHFTHTKHTQQPVLTRLASSDDPAHCCSRVKLLCIV